MRFIRSDGTIAKARRFVSGASNVQDEEVKNPIKLAEILRGLMRRVTDAEALLPPEAVEFEVTVGTAGATVLLSHRMNSAVRWYVTTWTQSSGVAYPISAPVLVQDASSDADNLVLRSYVAGRAIVRIEPAFAGIDMGVTTAQGLGYYAMGLAADANNSTTTLADTNLKFAVGTNELWDIKVVGTARVASGVAGMKYAFNGPAGSTIDGWLYSTNNVVTSRSYQQFLTVGTAVAAAVHTVAVTDLDDFMNVRIKTGSTAGIISLQMASAAAAVQATLKAKSTLIATRVPEV